MKKLLSIIALSVCLPTLLFAQGAPPIQRNYFTTNAAPVQGGATNGIQINGGVGTNNVLYNTTLVTPAAPWPASVYAPTGTVTASQVIVSNVIPSIAFKSGSATNGFIMAGNIIYSTGSLTSTTNLNVEFGQFNGNGLGISNVVARFVVGTLSNSITGNAATATLATNAPNGIQVANTNQIDPLRAVLYPRQSGATLSTGPYSTVGQNAGFIWLPGQGTIRNIWSVPEMGTGWTNSNNDLRLQIYADLGNNTNPPTAALKQFEIPLRDLFMNNFRFTSNGQYQVLLDSDWLFSNFASTNILVSHEVGTFAFRFPINYTNAIMLRITNASVANTLCTNGYMSVVYSSGNPLEYPHARLRNLRYDGAITGSASNYLGKVVGGTGAIVGIILSQLGAESPDGVTSDFVNWQDSNSIRVDVGSGGFWEMIGADDLFMNTFGSVLGAQSGDNVGTVNIVQDKVMTTARGDLFPMGAEQFRWLTTDPIWFTNGFHASVTPFGSLVNLKANLIYYTLE